MTNTALRPARTADLERALSRLRGLARLMDDQFEVPILKVKIGLDPLIGAIVGGGDWVTWLVSIYILWEAMRVGAPIPLLLKMAWNLTVDVLVGYVPVIGDLADVAIKANRRNVDLLCEHFDANLSPNHSALVIVPTSAIEKARPNVLVAVTVVLCLTILLFLIAAVPAVTIYWIFFSGR